MLFMWMTVQSYEVRRDIPVDPVWYLDSECFSRVLSTCGLMWLTMGITMFTQFMHFNDGNEAERHLTVVESLYLTTQIITTVGYGDMTPTSGPGKIFMSFYALTGVGIIGTLVQNLISDFAAEAEAAPSSSSSEGASSP